MIVPFSPTYFVFRFGCPSQELNGNDVSLWTNYRTNDLL